MGRTAMGLSNYPITMWLAQYCTGTGWAVQLWACLTTLSLCGWLNSVPEAGGPYSYGIVQHTLSVCGWRQYRTDIGPAVVVFHYGAVLLISVSWSSFRIGMGLAHVPYQYEADDDDEVMLNVLRCQLTY